MIGRYEAIPGWTCADTEALYDAAAANPFVETIVEVGVAYGRSIAYLAERVRPGVKVWGVDVWTEHMGGDNLPPDVYARMVAHGSPLDACVAEMTAAGVADRVTLLHEKSVDAAKRFADGSIDLVFIDACHEYEPVLEDIRAWLPKVKKDGILAGHDYSDVFPGVKRAVEKVFAFGPDARMWAVRGVVWRVRA